MFRTSSLIAAMALVAFGLGNETAMAQDTTRPSAAQPHRVAVDAAVSKAVEFLRGSQADDGSYSGRAGPGFTAVVTTSVLRHGRSPDDPLVARSLKYLEGFVQDDGAIYSPDSRIKTYETALGMMCFAAANRDGKYDEAIARAERFLVGGQFGAEDNTSPSDVKYGGAGYGGNTRPDLSNTSFLLEALESAGRGPDDEAVQRALVFVSRCQNLETELNTTPFAAKIDDGGFYYSPVGEGSSPAGETADGGLRSYGSMTYAGLKSMLFAGVEADDPRVAAALRWLAKHYSLEENPGLGQAGLYYYYHLMAKALDAVGKPTFEDANGTVHEWGSEMTAALIERQRADGSWVNDDRRWMEGDPNLATAFALLSLAYSRAGK